MEMDRIGRMDRMGDTLRKNLGTFQASVWRSKPLPHFTKFQTSSPL